MNTMQTIGVIAALGTLYVVNAFYDAYHENTEHFCPVLKEQIWLGKERTMEETAVLLAFQAEKCPN